MKTALNFLLLILLPVVVKADCSSGFIFYPKSKTVNKNTKIVIEAFGWEKQFAILKGLDDKYPVYLKSQNRKIKLTKEILIVGQYNLNQAIFKLDELLTPGEVYEIEIQNLTKEDKKYFSEDYRRYLNGRYEKVSWLAMNEIDNSNPEITEEIKFNETVQHFYGCGPAIFTEFKFNANDNSELLVLTELIEIESNQSSMYYVSATEGKLSIGHGMCAGAFKLESGKIYKIRFKFYDINGNTDDTWTEIMECKNPWNNKE